MCEVKVLTLSRFKRHRFMLVVASVIVGSALFFRVPSTDRVEMVGLSGIPMPSMCMSKSLFGVDCPGCGLTRSLLCFFQGDFSSSLALHRIGWVMAIAVLFQFPYRIYALVRKVDYPLGKWFPDAFAYFLIFLLVGNWILEQFL